MIKVMVLALLMGSTAWAQEGEPTASAAAEESEKDAGLGLSGSLVFSQSVGIGSFYRADTRLYIPSLALAGSWKVPGTDTVSMGAQWSMTLYGLADLDAYTDRDPEEAVRVGDVVMSLGSSSLYKDAALTGINLASGVSVTLPASKSSRQRTLLAGITPYLSLSRKFGFVSLSFTESARYNAYRYDNAVLDPDGQLEEAIQGCVPRFVQSDSGAASRSGELYACGGSQNADRSLVHSFSAGFSFTQKLSATLGFSLAHSLGIPRPLDEYSSAVTVASGNETQRDSTAGVLGLSYSLGDAISLSAGVSSSQGIYSSDGRRFRFPWWDFEGPQANRTSLYVDIAGAL